MRLFKQKKAMTLMEVLIVVSLIGMLSLAIYRSLSNGIKIWKKSQQLVIEEDVAIFFDKLANDLHNTFVFSEFHFDGDNQRMAFPALVQVITDIRSGQIQRRYQSQVGMVEYYFNVAEDTLYRRVANYSQALDFTFGPAQALIKGVERVHFRYIYVTGEEEVLSEQILEEVIPSTVEVTIEFKDMQERQQMTRLIDVPMGT